MDIVSYLINNIGTEIKNILNKHNIVDFRSDLAKNISLEDEFKIIIGDLKLSNTMSKARLAVVSKTNYRIQIGHYDSENKFMVINLRSIFENNLLSELITEFYDNNCSSIKSIIIKVLDYYKDELSEPESSSEYKNLKNDINRILSLYNKNDIEFIKKQISDFSSRYNKLEDFEKKKINIQLNKNKNLKESKDYNEYIKVKEVVNTLIENLIEDFYSKISKMGQEGVRSFIRKLYSGKSKTISSTQLELFDNKIKIKLDLIRKDEIEDREEQKYLAYYEPAGGRKFNYVVVYANNIGDIFFDESYVKLKIHSVIYHEIKHILNMNKKYRKRNKMSLSSLRDQLTQEEIDDYDYIQDPDEQEARLFQYISHIERYITLHKIEPTFKNAVEILDEILFYKLDKLDKTYYSRIKKMLKRIYP